MTDAADRIVWESDEEALYRAAHTQISTEADARAEDGSTPTDAATGDPARRDRYAEAIHRYTCADGECCCWEEDITPCAEVDLSGFVGALLPVADGELAGLRAEVSRAKLQRDEEEDRRLDAADELRALREGIKALSDEYGGLGDTAPDARDAEVTNRLYALLAPSPAATTGEDHYATQDRIERELREDLSVPASSGEAVTGEAGFCDHGWHSQNPDPCPGCAL